MGHYGTNYLEFGMLMSIASKTSLVISWMLATGTGYWPTAILEKQQFRTTPSRVSMSHCNRFFDQCRYSLKVFSISLVKDEQTNSYGYVNLDNSCNPEPTPMPTQIVRPKIWKHFCFCFGAHHGWISCSPALFVGDQHDISQYFFNQSC